MHVLRIILCAAYKRKRFSYASNPLPSLLSPPQTPECNNNYLTHSRSNYIKKKSEFYKFTQLRGKLALTVLMYLP